MILHATLSFEDVVAVVPDPDVLILMIQSTWLTEDGFLDTGMTNVLILNKFPCTLVNDMS